MLSCCFGHGALKEIEALPITQTSIRIGNAFAVQVYDSLIQLFINEILLLWTLMYESHTHTGEGDCAFG